MVAMKRMIAASSIALLSACAGQSESQPLYSGPVNLPGVEHVEVLRHPPEYCPGGNLVTITFEKTGDVHVYDCNRNYRWDVGDHLQDNNIPWNQNVDVVLQQTRVAVQLNRDLASRVQ